MPRCTRCDRVFSKWDDHCPACGEPSEEISELPGDYGAESFEPEVVDSAPEDMQHNPDARMSASPMVVIARFQNAAEAGYFAHELKFRTAIPSMLTADDSFDALNGYWSTRYALAVPESLASSAVHALKRLIDVTQIDDWDESASATESANHSEDSPWQPFAGLEEHQQEAADQPGVNWVPIVVTLTVGSIAFWAIRKAEDQPQPVRMAVPAGQHHRDFWDTLSIEPNPWVQRLDNHEGGIRELTFDRQRRVAIIREDINGDGVFEHVRQFRR